MSSSLSLSSSSTSSKSKKDGLIRDIYAAFVLYHGSIIIGLDLAFTSYFVENREGFDVFQEGLVGSMSIFARAVGSLCSVFVVDNLGRKMTMFLGFLISSVGWLAIFLASSPNALLIGRLICGLSIALIYAANVIYISEVCNKNRRGSLLAARMTVVSIGMNMVTLIAYFYHWKWVALLGVLVCASGSILLKYLPETKYWLILHNRYDEALESAMWFSGSESKTEIEAELKRIEYSCYERNSYENNVCSLFQRRSSVKALVSSILLVIFNSGCGRAAIITHVEHFFSVFQDDFNSKKLVIYLNVAEIFVCVMYVIFADRYNRRTVLYFTLYVLGFSLIGIVVYDKMTENIDGYSAPIVPVLLLCVYLMITVNGLWTNVTTFIAELAPNENRASILQIANCITSTTCGVYSTVMPYVLKNVHIHYVLSFFLFNVVCILALTRFVLPETNGKELYECGFHHCNAHRERDKT